MSYTSRKTTDINPYLVGNRVYNGTRSNPTMGPVDPMGYRERDLKSKARRNAILRRLQKNFKGNYGSADSLRRV